MLWFRCRALRRVVLLLGVLLLAGCSARAIGSVGSVAPAPDQPSATAPATASAPLQVSTPAGAATAVPVASTADALPSKGPAATPAAPPATAPASAPGTLQSYTSPLHGYTFNYPAGWLIDVQRPAAAGPASDTENVSLRPASGNLPVITVYAVKGADPIAGYENCVENLTIWDIDVCSISIPKGQGPAQQLLVFRKSESHYAMGIQYEDEGQRATFEEVVKSFRFTQPAPAAPAAAQVVFASRRAGQLQLYVMPVLPPRAQPGSDQANPRPLTQGQDWSGSPVVAPDGRRVAYVVETRRADGSPHDREIYLVDVQGGKPANLTSNPALDFDPAWSPDGKQIAFVSNRDGEATSHGIYVIDVAEAVQGRGDGSARRIVEDGQAPAWSPDGGRIAFISDRDTTGQFQAYLVNADGSGLRRLTDRARSGSGAGVGQPAWSPDGTRLALPAGWDGNREIYLLTVAGSGQPEPVNVTNDPGYDDYPAWSPDGKQIAFISTRPGSPGLYLMDGGGENVIALAPGLDAGQPAWSRDGTRLAFVVSGPAPDFDQDIYVVNRDGSGLANLSRSPGQDTFPAWAQIR